MHAITGAKLAEKPFLIKDSIVAQYILDTSSNSKQLIYKISKGLATEIDGGLSFPEAWIQFGETLIIRSGDHQVSLDLKNKYALLNWENGNLSIELENQFFFLVKNNKALH